MSPILVWEGGPDDEVPSFCPEGCGGLTEDPYGGPCQKCWDAVGKDEADYIDYPTPHHEDCDCDGCMTFRVERDRPWSS